MESFPKLIGQRLRQARRRQSLSQEKTAERAGLHPTYIGQLERGEKNATLESILRVSRALGVPLSELFANIDDQPAVKRPADTLYDMVQALPLREQERICAIVRDILDLHA